MPPTIAERTRFLGRLATAENKELCYEQEVDRLLASSAFGERWASVWLDQVRYADSKGLGLDGPRNIWKYRDWVIRSFNRDLPFDQFTVKQMAGDLLPEPAMEDFIATAAHRLTQTNEEGGTDDEEFRIAAVLDRTNTTWQTWQGITFGCVQCHNHPYDAITHQEYYQFAAFFNNTADSDLGDEWPRMEVPVDPSDYELATKLDRQIESLTRSIWETEASAVADPEIWRPVSDLQAKTNNKTKITVESKETHQEFHTVDTVSNRTDISLTAALPESLKTMTALRLTAMPLNPDDAVIDSEWGFTLSHFEASLEIPGNQEDQKLEWVRVIGDEAFPHDNPQESLNPKSNSGFSAYTRIFYPRTAVFVLKSPVSIPANARLKVNLKHRVAALGTFPLVTKRGYVSVTDSTEIARVLDQSGHREQRQELEKKKAKRKEIKSTRTPILKERPAELSRTQKVFIRGLFLTKGETVTPNTPRSLQQIPGKKNDRLALAQWLVRPDNPLTARVAVNRLWARLFGTGIVATEEDFGSSGEPPSHPRLLDYLALKFQNEYGWSQKKILREMVLSSTYRQSSSIRPEIQKTDSANRWLARGPRHRLSSEIVRDQALAISGLLSKKQFGPPVRPPIPDGVWKPFAGWDKWKTPEEGAEDRYRRAVYTYIKRSIPYPMFAAFDAPSREVCAPRRLQSNTPIQALMTLNDQTMLECAEAFARKLSEHEGALDAQLKFGFVTATCREPNERELKALEDLWNSYEENEKVEAWEAVASVLLNLDEVLTK